GREISRLKGVPSRKGEIVSIVSTFDVIFLLVALLILAAFMVFGDDISERWLEYKEISSGTVEACIFLMGGVVALRWVGLISRSGIDAYEEQKWLSVFDVLINTLRYPGSLLFVIFSSGNITCYFIFIFLVTATETVLLRRKLQ